MDAGGNIIAVVIELYNWYSRYAPGSSAIVLTGLILSLVVVLMLLFTGWEGLGNGLSSSRWRDRPGALRSLLGVWLFLTLKNRMAQPRQVYWHE